MRGRKRARTASAKPFKGKYKKGSYKKTYAQFQQGVLARRDQRVLNMAKAGLLGMELKYYDTSVTNGDILSPNDCSSGEFDPLAGCISAPAQGDGATNRDGKKIIIRSVQIKGNVHTTATSGLAAPDVLPQVFVALVLDTQTNGAQLTSEGVFTNPANDADLAAEPMRNLLTSPRFKVLKVWKLNFAELGAAVQVTTGTGTTFFLPKSFLSFEGYMKLDMPVNFGSGTTADVANVIDNSLHVIAFATDITMDPKINYNARIRFEG